jgi:hypothetical protein
MISWFSFLMTPQVTGSSRQAQFEAAKGFPPREAIHVHELLIDGPKTESAN